MSRCLRSYTHQQQNSGCLENVSLSRVWSLGIADNQLSCFAAVRRTSWKTVWIVEASRSNEHAMSAVKVANTRGIYATVVTRQSMFVCVR